MPRFVSRPTCPCCGGHPDGELYRKSFTDPLVRDCLDRLFPLCAGLSCLGGPCEKDFVILECRSCDMVWHKHILHEEDANVLYGQGIDHKLALAKQEMASTRHHLATLASVLLAPALMPHKQLSETHALDFGLGWGNWLRHAAALGMVAEGVEIAPDKVAHSRRLGLKVYGELDEAAGTYDVINCHQVLEHVSAPVGLLRNLLAKLNPDGLLLLSVPDAGPEIEALRRKQWTPGKGAIHPIDHVNGFTFDGFLRMCERAGLRLISPVGSLNLLDGGTRLVLDQQTLDTLPWILVRVGSKLDEARHAP